MCMKNTRFITESLSLPHIFFFCNIINRGRWQKKNIICPIKLIIKIAPYTLTRYHDTFYFCMYSSKYTYSKRKALKTIIFLLIYINTYFIKFILEEILRFNKKLVKYFYRCCMFQCSTYLLDFCWNHTKEC